MNDPHPGWLGYPRGAWLIIGVEFWERFSFYGMLAILALFLTGDVAHGGFGWSSARALGLVGAYSGAMYAFPAFGGYLADRVLGRRRAVALGASVMLLGQVLTVSGAYSSSVPGFYLALFFLIVGNALMKSTLVVLCGETFRPDDPRREGAFAYYYLGISVGAMLSGFIVGVASERYGWAYGFGAAAIGMAVSLSLYLLLGRRWLGNIGARAIVASDSERSNLTRARHARGETWRRVVLVLILGTLMCIFSTGWFQMFGSWSLFIEHSVDRSLGGFLVPVAWFSSINAAVVIAIAPAIAALWVRLAARNRQIDIVQKFIFAITMALVANTIMYVAGMLAAHGALAPLWMPILGVALLGLGEIVAWTATYGFVSRAAPAGLASVTMGAWYLLTLGLGGYLSGVTGRWVDSIGFTATFGVIAVVMTVGAAAALGLRPALARLAVRANVSL